MFPRQNFEFYSNYNKMLRKENCLSIIMYGNKVLAIFHSDDWIICDNWIIILDFSTNYAVSGSKKLDQRESHM